MSNKTPSPTCEQFDLPFEDEMSQAEVAYFLKQKRIYKSQQNSEGDLEIIALRQRIAERMEKINNRDTAFYMKRAMQKLNLFAPICRDDLRLWEEVLESPTYFQEETPTEDDVLDCVCERMMNPYKLYAKGSSKNISECTDILKHPWVVLRLYKYDASTSSVSLTEK